MLNNKKHTFWKLLGEVKVEIPLLQRDYAQGRTDKRTEQIRNNFITTLFRSIKDPTKSKDLDFIYGVIRAGKLTLLDGQQRLTTLFLLHWYLAYRDGAITDHIRERLLKFSYQTRVSSADFCLALINGELNLDKNKPSLAICDAAWFFLSWKKDPTIKAMLVVLDTIHQQYNLLDVDYDCSLWMNLVDEGNPPVTFQFLDMEKLKLTDELYIKMNSRGKALSDFENFKAWLQMFTENKEPISTQDWKSKLDKEWLDIFWLNRKPNSDKIDDSYLGYFKGMALNKYIVRNDLKDIEKDNETRNFITSMRNDEYLTTSCMEDRRLFDIVDLNDLLSLLSLLEGNGLEKINGYIKEIDFFINDSSIDSGSSKIPLFNAFCSEESTYPIRVIFHALSQFILNSKAHPQEYDEDIQLALFRWMRVVRNLVLNTTIEAPAVFVRAIKSIDDLSKNYSDIYRRLIDKSSPPKVFLAYQVEEEQLKSQLILDDYQWEQVFVECENHAYFRGQIGFLLELSKENGNEDDYSIELFKNYAAKAKTLFDENGLVADSDFLFQRALLAKGNYLMTVNSNHSFGENREEWVTKFLRNGTKVSFLRELFDDLEAGMERESLLKTIDQFSDDDWRKYFIKNKWSIKYCDKRKIRFRNSGKEIYLLKSIRMSGDYHELRSYCFFKEFMEGQVSQFTPFMNVDYYSGKGSDKIPCAYIDKWENNKTIAIDVKYLSDIHCFEIKLFDRGNGGVPGDLSQILLDELSFVENDKEFIKYEASEQKTIETLIKMTAEINTLSQSIAV